MRNLPLMKHYGFLCPLHDRKSKEASASLSQKISIGDKGIAEVTRSLCEVKVANAEAYDPRDEKKLKDTIRESVGFQVGASQNTRD